MNRGLHRRLAAIEAKANVAAVGAGRGCTQTERNVSPEEAERTYRRFIAACASRPKESPRLSEREALEQYLRLVRG
jgi:hypothetical protein